MITSNVNKVVEVELRAIKEEISRLKEELRNQSNNIELLRRKSEVQQTQTTTDDNRNRFQMIRKPANLVVSGGNFSTTYSTSPTIQQFPTRANDDNKEELTRLKEDL